MLTDLLRNRWPLGIAVPAKAEDTPTPDSIGIERDGFADHIVIERPIGRCRDSSRRLGMFTTADVQEPLKVNFYGLVKHVNLTATGTWNR